MAKILREHFIGETPVIKNVPEHKAFISSLKSDLEKIKGVDISSYYSSRDKDPDTVCRFSVQEEDDRFRYYRSDSFTIKFSQENELLIKHYSDNTIVYQVEQIYAFIDKLKVAYGEKKALRLKKEKINSLKQQAIIAKVKEIAKEDRFDFYTREYERKLKLGIRLEGGIIEVDIPYKEFQEMLKDLRSFIHNVRELQKSGFTFKLKADSGHRGYGWITHDSL